VLRRATREEYMSPNKKKKGGEGGKEDVLGRDFRRDNARKKPQIRIGAPSAWGLGKAKESVRTELVSGSINLLGTRSRGGASEKGRGVEESCSKI